MGTLNGGLHDQKDGEEEGEASASLRRRRDGGEFEEKREKRAPALNMSFHQLVSQHGLTHPGRDTYLIQYHTNIQLNTYKPILCNITQILYTRGHLTYSVMSPYTIRDISCYVVCKMTDRLILLCNMLQCTVLPASRPHPQKSLTKKIHLSRFTNPNFEVDEIQFIFNFHKSKFSFNKLRGAAAPLAY